MKRPIKFVKSTGDGGTKKKKSGSKASRVTKRKKSKPEYIMSHEVVELFCEKLNITHHYSIIIAIFLIENATREKFLNTPKKLKTVIGNLKRQA